MAERAARLFRRPGLGLGPGELALAVQLPLIGVAWLAWQTGRGGSEGFDLAIFRHAAAALVHGADPYVHPSVSALAQNDHYVYPAPFAYLFAPFLLESQRSAAIVFLLFSVGCIVLALRLLDVRDPRLYGLSILSAPSFDALGVGAIGPLLLLAVAAGWRLRDSTWSGVVFALAAAAKLFLWPLLVWLLVTRRFRASVAAGLTLAATGAVWAIVDLRGMREYPATLRALEQAHLHTYSLRSLWLAVGIPHAELAAPLVALVGVWLIARAASERAALAASIAVALLSTPMLWLHYLILLCVPLALYWRRLSWAWLVPLCLWVTPGSGPNGSVWRMALVLVAVAAVWSAVSARECQPAAAEAAG